MAARGGSLTLPDPEFLGREAYRRRRLVDAAYLLPVVGTVLFLLPMAWSGAGLPDAGPDLGPEGSLASRVDARRSLADAGLYLFTAWAALIAAAAIISRRLSRHDAAGSEPPPIQDGDQDGDQGGDQDGGRDGAADGAADRGGG